MTPVSPAQARLRQATSGLHARLDACFEHGLRDSASYHRYLQGMHGLLHALAAADVGLDAAFASHRAHLQADLAATGAGFLPTPTHDVIRIAGDSERLGARYVIEGSSLGARVLLRQAQTLGHDPECGATFLAYHVRHGLLHWPRCLQALAACDPDAADFAVLLQAARDTFALAATCFGQPHHTRGSADGR